MPSLGLYIHIPFCRSKCAYCDFYSLPSGEALMGRYLTALCGELRRMGAAAAEYRVDSVYFGGGTPSWFGRERLIKALNTVRESWLLTEDCEITMEANPDSVSPEDLSALRMAGFNRISLGLQSAVDAELRTAGRPHDFARGKQAVRWAREAGFKNLSLDLIYGLPGQTMESWQYSVGEILKLNPEHLSCYGLKLEEGTPFWKKRKELSFPDDELQSDEYLWLCRRLAEAGFEHYEISNFAKPGRASRHNLKYWRMEEYLGFGPGAHSDFRGVRFGITRDLEGYLCGVESDSIPLSEQTTVAPAGRLEEYLMLGLRLREGITEEGYLRRGGTRWSSLSPFFRELISHRLMRNEGGQLSLTDEGYLVSNAILSELMLLNEE